MNTAKSGEDVPGRRGLWRPVIVGGIIGSILVILFLSGADDPDPAWGPYWMVRPLVVVTLAGALGGFCYSLLGPLRYRGGLIGAFAYVFGILVFFIGLWLGLVLGLDGTYWD